MAGFTNSPGPARFGRFGGPSHASPPRATPRPSRPPGYKPPSRFATPVFGHDLAPSVGDAESYATGIDVDHDDDSTEHGMKPDTLFAKSEEMTATFYANLPVEVKQALRNANFYREAYTGDVDTLTGYALVASEQTCYVWKYSQALTGVPTCYIFVCPRETYPIALSTVFHALVPFGPTREPGLILMSMSGRMRFWDSIGMGLAGGDNFSPSDLELADDECVTTLTRADPQTYIVSTSRGRLFRLSLTAVAGRHNLSFHPFTRPQRGYRFIPAFLSTPALTFEVGNISAVALGQEGHDSRELWAVMDTKLQKWTLSREGWEDNDIKEDVELGDAVRHALRAAFPSAPRDDAELDLEFLDLKVESPEKHALLISYAGKDDDDIMDFTMQLRRIYAIVRLKKIMGAFQVDGVKGVPYQSTASSGAPIHPRLSLALDGQLVFIQFGDAVTVSHRDGVYENRLELKSAVDRTLGLGVVLDSGEILVLTAAIMLRAYFDMEHLRRFDPETGRANIIKSTMTQAILYGSHPENPLHFSFPPEVDEEALMSGAEKLSQAVLKSNPEVIRAQHDLHAQIKSRKERLTFLIDFINDNGALTKISQSSRQRLVTDAEKLHAAFMFWQTYSESLQTSNAHVMIYEAIHELMEEIGEGDHEDCVRVFFRSEVSKLGSLFPHIQRIIRSSAQHGNTLPEDLLAANLNTTVILEESRNYREYNKGKYGLDMPMVDPWTSQPVVIDTLVDLFALTTRLVETPTPDPEVAARRQKPKHQLTLLAENIFASFSERLDWLGSSKAPEGLHREYTDTKDKFQQLRPEVLETLRRNDYSDKAFELAQKYRDFRSLASLCNKGIVYPPRENPNASRIEAYVESFRDDFATELYQWYIEHGELRTMFEQRHDEYMDGFFEKHPHPAISWIHDLGKDRYEAAATALLHEADHAADLTAKHFMLSIGKLSHLAQLQTGPTAVEQDALDSFHDGLDYVDVHESVLEELETALTTTRSRQSVGSRVDVIMQVKTAHLRDRPALRSVFKLLVQQLCSGKALSVEDMAELLSLKDNAESVEDFTTALHLLANTENIPEARRLTTFKNVWRRIYLHDDWNALRQTANLNDAELNARLRATALYIALQAILSKRHQPEGYVLSPAAACDVPDGAEIAERWPGLSPDDAERVAAVYRDESAELAGLHLEEMVEGVRTLVAEDGGWGNI